MRQPGKREPYRGRRWPSWRNGDGVPQQVCRSVSDPKVEQLTLNQRVAGSSPAAPTNEINGLGLPLSEGVFTVISGGFHFSVHPSFPAPRRASRSPTGSVGASRYI